MVLVVVTGGRIVSNYSFEEQVFKIYEDRCVHYYNKFTAGDKKYATEFGKKFWTNLYKPKGLYRRYDYSICEDCVRTIAFYTGLCSSILKSTTVHNSFIRLFFLESGIFWWLTFESGFFFPIS